MSFLLAWVSMYGEGEPGDGENIAWVIPAQEYEVEIGSGLLACPRRSGANAYHRRRDRDPPTLFLVHRGVEWHAGIPVMATPS